MEMLLLVKREREKEGGEGRGLCLIDRGHLQRWIIFSPSLSCPELGEKTKEISPETPYVPRFF